jgi:hypothetical protein
VTATANADISVTGLAATGIIGFANVWGEVDDTQTPNWTPIASAQTPEWATASETQVVNWTPIASAQTPEWATASETQTPDWQDIAA